MAKHNRVPWGNDWIDLDEFCRANPKIDRRTAGLLIRVIARASRAEEWVHPGDCCGLMIQLQEVSFALFPDRQFIPPRRRLRRRKARIGRALAKQVFERDGYRCRECFTHIDLTVDHIVPESRGGATTLDNLRTLCRVCNSRKGDRMPDPA